MNEHRVGESPEEEDDFCDLDPTKHCDNCMKCVIGEMDYAAVQISGIQLEHELQEKTE